MTKSNVKTVTLRAFEIVNSEATVKNIAIVKQLNERLKDTHVSDRKLQISELDENKEADIIPHYTAGSKYVKGTMMRIAPKEQTPAIADALFSQEKFSVTDLTNIETVNSVIYKNHFYFGISNSHVVTNLPWTTTIRSFQAYINWLLEEQRDDFLYEFTPAIRTDEKIHLSEINKISIIDQERSSQKKKADNNAQVSQQKHSLSRLALKAIQNFISDSKDLKAIKDKRIISAELLIKFAKPRDMSDEDYKKALSAVIKPMSDIDNAMFHTKSGKAKNASELTKVKHVDIDLTESGKLSEPQLYLAMEAFLKELAK